MGVITVRNENTRNMIKVVSPFLVEGAGLNGFTAIFAAFRLCVFASGPGNEKLCMPSRYKSEAASTGRDPKAQKLPRHSHDTDACVRTA